MNIIENQENLIKALRGNRFTQIRNTLSQGRDNLCFAGVCYVVCGVQQDLDYLSINAGRWGSVHRLVAELGGILSYDHGNSDFQTLVRMNDEGKTFKEIANHLVKCHDFPDVYPDDYINEKLDNLEKEVPKNVEELV